MVDGFDEFGIPIKQSQNETDEFGIPIKKKVPTDPRSQWASGGFNAIKNQQSKLDRLLSQDKSSVYTPISKEDLDSESQLEDWTEVLLRERQKAANKSYFESIKIPKKERSPMDPLSAEDVHARLTKIVDDSKKLSKKLELSESEASTFFNPLIRTTGRPQNIITSNLKGMDFWANEYNASKQLRTDETTGQKLEKGFEMHPFHREDGVIFDKLTVAPVALKKVMDDYANFLQKTQPEKFKYLSLVNRGEMTPEEAIAVVGDAEKWTKYVSPYVDKAKLRENFTKGKNSPVPSLDNVSRYNLMMEAINHQSIILDQDYKEAVKAGVGDADARYKQGRAALSNLTKEIIKSNPEAQKEILDRQLVQLDEAIAQSKTDLEYLKSSYENPMWNAYYTFYQPVEHATRDFLSGVATLPRELGISNVSTGANEIVKFGESIAPKNSEQPTQFKESLVPKVVRGVTDMMLMLYGTKGLGSVKSVGYKPSLMATNYVSTHDNYYREFQEAAKMSGISVSDDQATDYANTASFINSVLQLVSPNTKLINGFQEGITPLTVEKMAKGLTRKDAIQQAGKDLISQIAPENVQEIIEYIADKGINYQTNEILGKPLLDAGIKMDDIFETMLVTTAVTGLVTAPHVRNKSALQRDFMYTAATQPAVAEQAINNAVETEKIDKKQADMLRKKLTDYKSVIDGLPASYPNAVKSKLADLVYQKKLISEQKTESYVDPVFKNVKEAEQLSAEQEIDQEIQNTINDTKDQIGIQGGLQEGETVIETKSIEEGGGEKIESDRVFQTQEPTVDEAKPDEAMDAYVNRMVEEHKAEGDVVGPVETEFVTKFYTKKWMDKFGAKTQPVDNPIVLTEQQIEEEPYGESEAANAFEGRIESDVIESEAAIQALELEAEDVERSQDRARAAQIYGAAGELIDQSVTDSRTQKGYTVQNKDGNLTVLNTEGQPVKSKKVRQSVLRNYKKSLRVLNDSGTLRVVDESGAEVTGPEFTETLIQKYKESFPYDQGRTSVEVAEAGDPVVLSENPMELAAIGTPEAAAKFKLLTGVDMAEYNAPKVSEQDKTLRERFNKSIDEAIRSFDKLTGSFIIPPQVIKAALRTVKAAVNAGFTLEEAIRKGVDTVRKSQWFKAAGNPEEAVQAFTSKVSDVQRMAESDEPIAETPKKDIKAINAAKKGRKQIAKKIRAKQKGATSVFANDRSTLKEFVKLDPREVSDVNEYNDIVNRIKESLNNPIIRSDGSIKRGGRVVSNAEISQYIDKEEKFIKQNREAKAREEYGMLLAEGIDIDAILSGEIQESMLKPDTREQKRQAIKALVDKKMSALSAFVKLKDEEGSVYENWTPAEKQMWDILSDIDTTDMSITDLVSLNNVLENVATNESLDGAGKLAMLSQAQKIVPEVTKLFEDIDRPGKITKGAGQVRNVAYSLPLMIERITLDSKKAAELNRLLGLSELFAGNTIIDKRMEKITKEVDDMKRTMKDPDSLKNRFTRGMYAFLIRNKGGDISDIELEFTRKKSIIEDQIKTLTSATDTALQEQGKLIQEIYNDLGVADAVTYEDLKIDSDNKKIVDKFKEEATTFRDELDEHSRLFNNQGITPENNYTAVSYQALGETIEEGLADVESSGYGRDQVFQGASRTTLATRDNWALPRDNSGKVTKILNLDFDNVQARKIREALYEIGTQDARVKFSKLINNPQVVKAMGGEANKDALVRAVKSSVEAQMRIMPYKPAVQAINNVLNFVSAKGTRIALASLAQPLNQIPSVWANASFNLGLPRAMEMWYFPKVSDNLFRYGTILNRKGMRGGYQRQLAPADIEKVKSTTYKIGQALKVPRAKWDAFSNSLMGPLVASDFLVAKKSWMAYYKKFRQQDQGAKDFDWQAEAENPDPVASAYAEQMVDRSQNVSEYSKQGEWMRRSGDIKDIVKNVIMPFSGFAVNQRGRLYNDMSKIGRNPLDEEAWKSLGGTMAEIAAFNAVKLYAIYAITAWSGDLLATALGFTDEDEREDPEKLTKLGAKSIKDLLFSGMGSMVEHYGTKVVNEAYKEVAGTDKEIIPLYSDPNDIMDWQQFGLYGTTVEAADEMARDFKAWWTGKTPAIVKGGPKYVEAEGNLTDRERTAMGVFGLYELLKIAGISDQLLNSTFRKAKSRVETQIRKREGTTYETTMGLPGSAYRSQESSSRNRVRRTTGERSRRNRN